MENKIRCGSCSTKKDKSEFWSVERQRSYKTCDSCRNYTKNKVKKIEEPIIEPSNEPELGFLNFKVYDEIESLDQKPSRKKEVFKEIKEPEKMDLPQDEIKDEKQSKSNSYVNYWYFVPVIGGAVLYLSSFTSNARSTFKNNNYEI